MLAKRFQPKNNSSDFMILNVVETYRERKYIILTDEKNTENVGKLDFLSTCDVIILPVTGRQLSPERVSFFSLVESIKLIMVF